MSPEQVRKAVDAAVAAANLPLTDEDYKRLLASYPLIHSQLAALRIPEARYREPAVIFPA